MFDFAIRSFFARRPGLACLLGAVLLVAPSLHAQERDPRLRQSLSTGWAYNDNRDGVATNQQGLSEFTLGYRADRSWQDGDRSEFKLFFAPVAFWRSAASRGAGALGSQAALRGSLGFDLRQAVTPRTELTAGDTLRSSDILSGGSSRDAAARDSELSLVNDARLGASLALAPQETLLLSLGETRVRTLGSGTSSNNVPSDTYRASATLAETLNARRRLLFTTGVQQTRQQQSDNTTNAAQSTLYSATVGWEETFDPDLVALLQAGGQSAQQAQGGGATYGWTADANLTAGATTPTRTHLGVHYGIQPSTLAGYSVSRTLTTTAGIDHDVVPERLTLGAQGSLLLSWYDVGVQGGSDRTITLDLTASYRLTPDWTLQGSVGHEDWQSELRSSFRRNRVSLSVSTTF